MGSAQRLEVLLPHADKLGALGQEIGSCPVVCGAGRRAAFAVFSQFLFHEPIPNQFLVQFLFTVFAAATRNKLSVIDLKKAKNILSFFATHRKLGSRGTASKIVNKN